MSGFYDEPENDHALRAVNVETRNAIPALAVQIVASKYDLKTAAPEALVRALHEEISLLQSAYSVLREHGF